MFCLGSRNIHVPYMCITANKLLSDVEFRNTYVAVIIQGVLTVNNFMFRIGNDLSGSEIPETLCIYIFSLLNSKSTNSKNGYLWCIAIFLNS
jgi:hypothetical protein